MSIKPFRYINSPSGEKNLLPSYVVKRKLRELLENKKIDDNLRKFLFDIIESGRTIIISVLVLSKDSAIWHSRSSVPHGFRIRGTLSDTHHEIWAYFRGDNKCHTYLERPPSLGQIHQGFVRLIKGIAEPSMEEKNGETILKCKLIKTPLLPEAMGRPVEEPPPQEEIFTFKKTSPSVAS